MNEQAQKVVDDAERFVNQLEVLGYDKNSGRFDCELSPKDVLSYKDRLTSLIDSVNNLHIEEEM